MNLKYYLINSAIGNYDLVGGAGAVAGVAGSDLFKNLMKEKFRKDKVQADEIKKDTDATKAVIKADVDEKFDKVAVDDKAKCMDDCRNTCTTPRDKWKCRTRCFAKCSDQISNMYFWKNVDKLLNDTFTYTKYMQSLKETSPQPSDLDMQFKSFIIDISKQNDKPNILPKDFLDKLKNHNIYTNKFSKTLKKMCIDPTDLTKDTPETADARRILCKFISIGDVLHAIKALPEESKIFIKITHSDLKAPETKSETTSELYKKLNRGIPGRGVSYTTHTTDDGVKNHIAWDGIVNALKFYYTSRVVGESGPTMKDDTSTGEKQLGGNPNTDDFIKTVSKYGVESILKYDQSGGNQSKSICHNLISNDKMVTNPYSEFIWCILGFIEYLCIQIKNEQYTYQLDTDQILLPDEDHKILYKKLVQIKIILLFLDALKSVTDADRLRNSTMYENVASDFVTADRDYYYIKNKYNI